MATRKPPQRKPGARQRPQTPAQKRLPVHEETNPYPGVEAGNAYARNVVSGKIPACKWIKLAARRHLRDLEKSRSRRFPYYFSPAHAQYYMDFVQSLPHTKDRWAARRERIRFEPWQCFAWGIPFGWLNKKTGKRRFTQIEIYVPRKNGKSIIAAATGHYMAWADGEFGAEVYSGATTERQAWEVFRPALLMAQRLEEFRLALGIEPHASNMARMTDGSRFEPIVGKPGDGSSPHCAIADEYHEHPDNDQVDAMITGMGAREQPIMLIISTSGVSIGGPCYMSVQDGKKMLEGTVPADNLWFIYYTIDEKDDWTTELALRKANPNYDISVRADFLKSEQRRAMASTERQSTFRRKHLNEWVGAKLQWMNMLLWGRCPPRRPIAEMEGRTCYIALDLATKIDIVAKAKVFPPSPEHGDPNWSVYVDYFVPEARVLEFVDSNSALYQKWHAEGRLTTTEGEIIDFEVVKDSIREDCGRFDVREVAYDPWQATQMATELTAEGITMVELRQVVANMSEPMKEVQKLAYSRKLAHGSDEITDWMISNVVAKIDAKDNIFPRKETAANKIDGAVAIIMAINRATLVERQGPSVYETRGLIEIQVPHI